MKKLYCVICGKYRKIEKPKMPYFFEKKTFVLSIICNISINQEWRFKEEEPIEILKILGLISNKEKYQNIYSCLRKIWIKNFNRKK